MDKGDMERTQKVNGQMEEQLDGKYYNIIQPIFRWAYKKIPFMVIFRSIYTFLFEHIIVV